MLYICTNILLLSLRDNNISRKTTEHYHFGLGELVELNEL